MASRVEANRRNDHSHDLTILELLIGVTHKPRFKLFHQNCPKRTRHHNHHACHMWLMPSQLSSPSGLAQWNQVPSRNLALRESRSSVLFCLFSFLSFFLLFFFFSRLYSRKERYMKLEWVMNKAIRITWDRFVPQILPFYRWGNWALGKLHSLLNSKQYGRKPWFQPRHSNPTFAFLATEIFNSCLHDLSPNRVWVSEEQRVFLI